MEFSEDAAAEVVLQGGLRAIVNILSNYSSDRQVCCESRSSPVRLVVISEHI